MIDITPDEVADEILSQMQRNGTWESFRIKVASELKLNGDFKRMKAKVREMLNTNELKLLMRNMSTTEEMVAAYIERSNGFAQYKNAAWNMVDIKGAQKQHNGNSIAAEFKETVNRMIDDYVEKSNAKS